MHKTIYGERYNTKYLVWLHDIKQIQYLIVFSIKNELNSDFFQILCFTKYRQRAVYT